MRPSPKFLALSLEILHRALMLLGGGASSEGAQIAASACFRIQFPRVQPVGAAGEFSDHRLALLSKSWARKFRAVTRNRF